MKKWNNKIKCSVSFPPEIWFDLSFFRVNQFVPAVTQMSLHVVYFKWIEGPRVVCGLASSVKSSTCPLAPSSLWLFWPPHHFLQKLCICFFIFSSFVQRSDNIVFCVLCSNLFTLIWSLLRHSHNSTPHSDMVMTRLQWQKTLVSFLSLS